MTERGKQITKDAVVTVIKVIIVAAIIWWFCREHGSTVMQVVNEYNYLYLIPVLLITLLSTWVTSIRWRDLALSTGIELSEGKAFSLTMQGIFFSLVIPGGAVGGDVVKMTALAGCIKPGTRTEGVFSILMDRLVGMFALFLIAPVLLLFTRDLFAGIDLEIMPWLTGKVLWWSLMGICICGLASGVALLMHRTVEKIPGIRTIMDFADRRSKGQVSRILAAADSCVTRKKRLAVWIMITILLVHLLPVASMYILLAGAGVSGAFMPVVTAVVMGNIAGLIPLFPGGVGGRDVVTVALLIAGAYPQDGALAAQVISTVLLIIFNLSGALFFLCDRKKSGMTK